MLLWKRSSVQQRPQICIPATQPLPGPTEFPVSEPVEDQSYIQPVPGKTEFPVVDTDDDPLSKPRPVPYSQPVSFPKELHREETFPCLTAERLQVTGHIESVQIRNLELELCRIRETLEDGTQKVPVDISGLSERLARVEALVFNMQGFLKRTFSTRSI